MENVDDGGNVDIWGESCGISPQKLATGLLNFPLSNVECLKSTVSTVSIMQLIDLIPCLGRSPKDVPDKKNLFSVQDIFRYSEAEGKGASTDPAKIETMKNWPRPTSTKAVRGFLGLTGYYRRFVLDYGLTARPLTALLNQNKLQWNSEAQAAFQALKASMTKAPVLALLNF
ncbi:hypothetical protein Nepgr_013593 [Nepenthes gracilis]|uniref:Mitochondrial protein n=1 Tax=Nepenthes gracilis TaxID=150966 RepID=A0AAD3SIP4_NEPGR|nr:hypothetical protein Nepgr_013593 [Nepenthes gracilis]